ncbi:MAG TPA: AgmX/PglI C-terminal domain-containing protein [Kofleriaceae bacterium]|nr:AgmX/PglI C-terminal domain-containing protein [Kofleriaceae bacterium]
MRHVLIALAFSAACTRADKEPLYKGEMPIAFGECAGPSVAFVSGPRPLPFEAATVENLVAGKVAKDEVPKPEPEDPPPNENGGGFASLIGTGDISSGFDDTNIYGGLLGNEAGEMNGGFGFGRSGFGPGGGGQGIGTIGTGRYGTIGHGSGTGSGYGVGGGRGGMRGRTSAVPTVSIGQPNAQGDLDKAIIRRYIKRNIQKITYCYEKQLLVKPKLAGTVQTQFFITPNGNVAKSSGSGVDPEVADCVAGVIKDIEFPKPKGGGGVQVNYPFTFRPAGDTTTIADAPAAGAGSDAGSAAAPPAPDAGSAAAAPAPTGELRHVFRAWGTPVPDASKYDPGANNPLRALEKDLSQCFRRGPNHFGAVVVELTYDASGKTTNAVPHGVTHESARKCVEKVAKRVTRGAGAATTQRCSLSFGVMPVSALPAIDITSKGIALDGRSLITIADADTQSPGLARTIPSVREAIEARVDAVTQTDRVVTAHGPLVIKPLPKTPMKYVDGVARSVLRGGDDFVLATSDGSEWKLLSPLTLPLVPVPFSSGGRWNRYKGRFLDGTVSQDDERVVLSILISSDRMWLGLSRVNEFQELPAGPDQLGKLAAALKAQKASAFFVDRDDIEIAGDSDVPYETFVKIVEAAEAAGFKTWQHTSPDGLAARPQL